MKKKKYKQQICKIFENTKINVQMYKNVNMWDFLFKQLFGMWIPRNWMQRKGHEQTLKKCLFLSISIYLSICVCVCVCVCLYQKEKDGLKGGIINNFESISIQSNFGELNWMNYISNCLLLPSIVAVVHSIFTHIEVALFLLLLFLLLLLYQ